MTRLIVGVNDLATLHPELTREWDYNKNKDLLPNGVTTGSNKKVWWRCCKGHEWQATISERTRKDKPSGCPYCAHKKVLSGENDLASLHPELVLEWDYQKNSPLSPEKVFANSNKKVWWKCKRCGHEWQATISSRAQGHDCPLCDKGIHTSFQEQAIFYYMKQLFPDTINGYIPNWDGSKAELDVFIPDLNLGIEYDGQRWHQNTKKDKKKTDWVIRNGVQLVRIREPNCPELKDDSDKIIIKKFDNNYEYLERAIRDIFVFISSFYGMNTSVTSDIQTDYQQILANYEKNKFNDSLAAKYPEIADEWDYEKNTPLTPQNVTSRTYKKVWWKCKRCGNSYLQAISNRTIGTKCPYCAGKKVLIGFNDLMTIDPILASEWNTDRNGDLTPYNVTASSRKRVWWKCKECGYEWQAWTYSRSTGVGCPACANKAVWAGHNDLATTNPKLAEEWDYERNSSLLPSDITEGSQRKVWWKCKKCGHQWKTAAGQRSRGSGCPQCAKEVLKISAQKQNLIYGKNDLRTYCPELIKEWDYERNNNLLPEDFTVGSSRTIWWKCKKCGYKWQAAIFSRVNGTGCPKCRSAKMSEMMKEKALRIGENDLYSINALLSEEWEYERNAPLTPKDVTAGSSEKVWWKCKKCGYVWQARINHRVKGIGCPVCANKTVWPGHNDLATTNPEFIEEWDCKRNAPLTPKGVTAGSGKKVWWKCRKCGYIWEARINHHVKGVGCPVCANRVVWLGHNDLATTNPELAEEWDYKQNGILRPENVAAGSGKKVWWKCKKCGYEYEKRIVDKVQGCKCPNCSK